MISIDIGSKVELKYDGQIYIVEAMFDDQLSIRKYYQETSKQIDVTVDDILRLPYTSNEPLQNEETYDEDYAVKRKREVESRSQFLEFRKNFFKIPSETVYDPFYFCLIPNIKVLMMWILLLTLVAMSCVTIMFCLCSLVFANSFWCVSCQTLLAWLAMVLQAVCRVSRHLSFQSSFKGRFVQVLSNTVAVTFLSMAFELQLTSRWPIIFTPLLFSTYFFLWGNLIQPLMEYFFKSVSEINTEFMDEQIIKRRNMKNFALTGVLHFMQIYLFKFWMWGPPKILHVMGHNHGSFLIIFFLLKILNYGFLKINCFLVNKIPKRAGIFFPTQFRCLFSAAFSEVLVLSNVREYELIVFVCFRFVFDLCEAAFHASDTKKHILKMFGCEVTPQPIDVSINQRSSYICASVIVEIIVPLYFYIAILTFLIFGQDEQILFLGTTEIGTLLSSFVGPRILIGLVSIVNIFINSQSLEKISSDNNIRTTLDCIYLVENLSEILILTPMLLVGYLLITCRFFTA